MPTLLSFARGLFWMCGVVHIAIGLAFPFLIWSTLGRPRTRVLSLVVAMLVCGLGALACQAARAMKRQGRGARAWVALGSLVVIALFPLGTIAGAVGFAWCAWPRLRAVETPVEDFEYKPQSGDGTHRWVQLALPVISLLIWVGAIMAAFRWGTAHGLPGEGAVNGLVLLLLCDWLATALHEGGHALAGWWSGMSLTSVAVGPLIAQRRSGRWRVQFSLAAILRGGGAVTAAPLHLENLKSRMAVQVAGGPAASILTALAAFAVLQMAPGSAWQAWWKVPAVTAVLAAGGAITNLIPFRFATGFSDGAALVQLLRGGPFADIRRAVLMMGATTVTPQRPRDIDPCVLATAVEATAPASPERATVQLLAMICAVDRGNLTEARDRLSWALEQVPSPDKAADAGSAVEMATYMTLLDGNAERAAPWLRNAEKRAQREGHGLTDSFDYWCAATAVNRAEGLRQQAEESYRRATDLAAQRPACGLYTFEWELLNRVYQQGQWAQQPSGAAC